MEQLYESEKILNNFKNHKMYMDDCIVVSSIIDKLPSPWKNFKRSLKHKKDDMSLEEFANILHVEEEYRLQDDNKEHNASISKVHVVEEGESSSQIANKKSKLSRTGTMDVRKSSRRKITTTIVKNEGTTNMSAGSC